jgi:hypothetical protein
MLGLDFASTSIYKPHPSFLFHGLLRGWHQIYTTTHPDTTFYRNIISAPHRVIIASVFTTARSSRPQPVHTYCHAYGSPCPDCTNPISALERCAQCPCRRSQVFSPGILSATGTTPLLHQQHGQRGDIVIASIAPREGPNQRLRTTFLRSVLQPASTMLKTCLSFFPESRHALSAVGKREAAVVQCTLNLDPCLQRRRFSLHVLARQPSEIIR